MRWKSTVGRLANPSAIPIVLVFQDKPLYGFHAYLAWRGLGATELEHFKVVIYMTIGNGLYV